LHLFAFVCVGLYTVMSATVGVRLIKRAIPNRHVPEILMGTAYLLAPGLGYPMVVIGSALPERTAGLLMFCAGQVLIVMGCTCFFFFNARVFRPGVVYAQAAAALGAILLAIAASEITRGQLALGAGSIGLASVSAASVTMLTVLGLAYGWTAYEGFRHNRMMRRRAAVGLGDSVVANRFLLWAIAGSVQFVSDLVAAHSLQMGGNMTVDVGPVLATALAGVCNSALLVLIFMPPARYVRWLLRDPQGALAPS